MRKKLQVRKKGDKILAIDCLFRSSLLPMQLNTKNFSSRNFERTPNYDFIYVFMKSEEEVLSLLADFLIHFQKKIVRNNPSYDFFFQIFFFKILQSS